METFYSDLSLKGSKLSIPSLPSVVADVAKPAEIHESLVSELSGA